MRLILIRHGQTPANVRGELDSRPPGPGLTDLGVQQAALLPEALRQQAIDSITASILVRTQLTAAPLASDRGLEVEVAHGLHEIQSGDLEKHTDADSVRRYLETAFAWGSGDLDVRMPGAENGHEFFARYDADVRAIEGSGAADAVVVSHGAAIRVWVAARATNVPATFAAEHDLGNTGIVILDGSIEHGYTLRSWQGDPIVGTDAAATDPTGETLGAARAG